MDEKVVVVYIYTPDDGNSWDNPPEFLASGSMKTKVSWRNKKNQGSGRVGYGLGRLIIMEFHINLVIFGTQQRPSRRSYHRRFACGAVVGSLLLWLSVLHGMVKYGMRSSAI